MIKWLLQPENIYSDKSLEKNVSKRKMPVRDNSISTPTLQFINAFTGVF